MHTYIITTSAVMFCIACIVNTPSAQVTTPEKYVQVGETNDDVHLKLKGQDNDVAMEWDDGKAQLRHHYNTLQTTRGWLRFYLDADNTLNNEEFSIFKDTSGVIGFDALPELRFQLDGGQSWINSGNFGIGLNTPSSMLHVNAREGTDPLRIQYDGGTKLRIFQNGSVSIGTNNSNVSADDVYIHNSLGIGVSQPQERLELNGAVRLGPSTGNANGVIRFANGSFEGRAGNQWRSLLEDADPDPLNEIQTLAIQDNFIRISGANSVPIPPGRRLEDTDGDTFIDTEASGDDDQINIDLAGQSRVRFARSSTADKTYLSFPNNDGNILIGATGALTANSGTDNIYIGSGTSSFNEVGDDNIMIGKNVGTLGDGQYKNVYIGNDVATGNTGNRNVTLGYQAGSTDYYALSVVLGCQAGQYLSDSANVLIGYQTGRNLAAPNNTYIGGIAGSSATTSSNGTFVGYAAGLDVTTGSSNTLVGTGSGTRLTTGNNNTCVGRSSGPFITTAGDNVCIGSASGFDISTGYDNTALGTIAGQHISTGFRNTCVGFDAGPGSVYDDAQYSSALGWGTENTASFQVRIGAANVTSIGGHVGWSNISDGRFKTNVRENVPGLDFVNALRPVTYNLDADGLQRFLSGPDNDNLDEDYIRTLRAKSEYVYSGFIAQEVEEAAEELDFDFSGVDEPKNDSDPYALRYAEFVVPLVKATQELSEQNEELQKELAELKAENAELRSSIDAIHSALQSNGITVLD